MKKAKFRRILLKLSGEVLRDNASGECLSDAILAEMAAQNRADPGSVTVRDLELVRRDDVLTAVAEACDEKHVPATLRISTQHAAGV